VGELSDIVSTDSGLHIILRTAWNQNMSQTVTTLLCAIGDSSRKYYSV
jgi:hypothetical protein